MADAEFETAIRMQRQELVSAQTLESDLDLDLAFNLLVQETVIASLAHQASSSSCRPPHPSPPNPNSQIEPSLDLISLQTREFDRFHQEKLDSLVSRLELERIAADLRQQSHDERFAREINTMADDEWEDWGDEFERPMGKGEEKNFMARVYFKGLGSDEEVNGRFERFSGIGVAVCDEWDQVLLKVSKPMGTVVNCWEARELKAMVEALNVVVGMGIRDVDVFLDNRMLYKHVTGQWVEKQGNHINLINQVQLLQRKFNVCNMHLVPCCNVKYVFELAWDAIDSQLKKKVEVNAHKHGKETCIICLEDRFMSSNEAIKPLPESESSSKQPAHGKFGLRKRAQCNGSCSNCKRLNPQNHGEEFKLKALARKKLWRHCIKCCKHMIQFAEGCFNISQQVWV